MEVLDELSSEPWGTLVVAVTDVYGEAVPTSYFIKSKFSSASYVMLVTDLTSVWVQSCDRAEIKQLKQVRGPPPLSAPVSLIS
jgi:hypothetical protein